MIAYINDRLNTWVDWRVKGRRIAGLGYPSCVSFYRLAPLPSRAIVPMPNEECCATDRAVCDLRKHHAKLFETVMQFYTHAGTAQSHAKALGIDKATLFRRIHQAHIKIMEYLQDEEENLLTERDSFAISNVI